MKPPTAVFATLLLISATSTIKAQSPDEVLIGPIDYTQNVNGIQVKVTAYAFLKVITADNKISLHVRVVGNLGDLQQKFGAIVDTFSLPKNNCGTYSPIPSEKNSIVNLPRKELVANADSATFSIGGIVTMWACVENPVPNSKLEWRMQDIKVLGRKIGKTKVPVWVRWPGNPIKAILGTQPFDANLPVYLVKNSDHAVGIQFSKPDIELKGQYVFIAKGVLNIAGVDINQKAHDALQKAIDPSKLIIIIIPDDIQKYNPIIDDAKLFNDSGHLAAEIDMSAFVPGSSVNQLVKELLEHKK